MFRKARPCGTLNGCIILSLMKKIFLLIILFLPLFSANAQIEEGGAKAESSVETKIEGSGNVRTRIETQANEKREVLEASGPGTYKLEVKSDSSVASKTPTPTPEIKEKRQEKNSNEVFRNLQNFINKILDFISNFFK